MSPSKTLLNVRVSPEKKGGGCQKPIMVYTHPLTPMYSSKKGVYCIRQNMIVLFTKYLSVVLAPHYMAGAL